MFAQELANEIANSVKLKDRIAELEARIADMQRGEPVAIVSTSGIYRTMEGLNLPIGTKLYAAPVRPAQLTDEERIFECNECTWAGPLSETSMCGSVGPLCPECRETTFERPAIESASQVLQLSDAEIDDWRIDTSTGTEILMYKDCSVIEGEQARFVIDLIGSSALEYAQDAAREDFCYCGDDCSLQIVSGGAAQEGLYGRATLKINGEYVDYVRAKDQTGFCGLTRNESAIESRLAGKDAQDAARWRMLEQMRHEDNKEGLVIAWYDVKAEPRIHGLEGRDPVAIIDAAMQSQKGAQQR